MTTPYFPDAYASGPSLPLVPHVDYPVDLETDRQLHEAERSAREANDPRAEVDARLELAHRAMVPRDALLGELVAAVRDGNGDRVLHRAPLYAFWHGVMERHVEDAAGTARRFGERHVEEAER
jgi:hypothetical protein